MTGRRWAVFVLGLSIYAFGMGRLLFPNASAQVTNLTYATPSAYTKNISAQDTFRVKAWNSWPQTEQLITTNPACNVAGPENFQAKVVIKYSRTTNPNLELTATKIMSMDNDRSAAGLASAPSLAVPFGRAAGKGRTVTDGNCTLNTRSISSCTVANPTVCLTSTAHGLTTGDLVVISASTTTPTIDGYYYVTVTDSTHIQLAINVTNTGTATLNASRTLTSPTLAATAADVGKSITVSGGAALCAADGSWGTGGGPGTILVTPCQGPKMPAGPGVYQGTIISVTNSTTVVVKPSFTAFPTGTSTVRLEPTLLADDDGLELGDGILRGVDINYMQAGGSTCAQKRGQSFFEAEINRGPWNMHEGITLIKQYMEPSGHLSWPIGNVASGKVDGMGFSRSVSCPDPAANTEVVCTVPLKAHWRVLGFTAAFTSDANAAIRTVGILVRDLAGNVTDVYPSQVTQTINLTFRYTAGVGISGSTVTPTTGGRVAISMPPLELLAGQSIETVTQNRQATDDFAVPFVRVIEYIEE